VLTKDATLQARNQKTALPQTLPAGRNFARAATAKPLVPNLTVYVLNVSGKELVGRVMAFRDLIEQKSDQADQAASELYDLLLKPASQQLSGKNSLVVIPDSVLWNVPFAALRSAGNHYLIEDFALSYGQSLSALKAMTRPQSANHRPGSRVPDRPLAPPQLLAFANPLVAQETLNRARLLNQEETASALPDGETEVKALRQMYGEASQVFAGLEASETRFKAEAEKCSILHLATNTAIYNASPMYSYALLSQTEANRKEDGLLQAWELMRLNLRARAVVLSACLMSQKGESAGDGLTGLSWGFFVAGAPSTVVSQWRTDSGATEFTLEFHRHLKAQVSPAQALRQSALKMLKGQQAHPYYWARFLVIGDSR
jgi:CHAT domain-containing protein